jgi:hypothetical protein
LEEKIRDVKSGRGDAVFSQKHFGFGIGHRSIENIPEEAK